ncbi:toll-like receptor 13 [Cheilinus undulatus]|uniref:toll-like receptor 13 n=1 Tax=Cheilinus undulatus TaxID=241271 RepID=UPI001BD45DE3|nr:toll-like receptor 13 [Cheilinus undulatus]
MMNINISTRLRVSTMESPSSNSVQRLLLFLLCLLLLHHPLLAYSLKNCTFVFDEDESAEFLLDCSFHNLLTVPDDIPRDAHTLQLSHNLIRRINKNDFGNMSQLSFLSLDGNFISHVDDGSFVHLVSLKELRMADNQLTHLKSNIFQGLSNLTELDLTNNSFNFFDNSAFHFLTSLQTVILDFNRLKKVTDIQQILNLPHIEELSIADNLFSTFESKDLNLNVSSSLRELNVEGNDLRRFSITTPIFPHLHTIHLGQCGTLSPFKWDIPDKSLLRNITRLDFSRSNAFEDIEKVLQSLNTLKQLQLNYMRGLMSKELLASICRIPTLESLDLSYNDDANLSAKLEACSQLKELDLSCTNISELPVGSIGMMKQLRSLNLEENVLTKVPEDIRSLSSLRVLRLDVNCISELSCEDFTNTSLLTELSVADNQISKLDWCVFKSLDNLKVLDLSYNPLSTFGETFKLSLKNLEILNLRNHFVRHLERGDFEGLGSLQQLDLESDEISEVEKGAFKGLYNLTSLNISLSDDFDCNFWDLDQIEDLTINFPSLSSLKSHHENLNKFDFDFKTLKRLKMVCSDIHQLTTQAHIEMIKSAKLLEEFTADNIFFSTPNRDTFLSNPQLRSLTITLADLSDLGPELFWPIPNLQTLDLSNANLKSLDFLAHANLTALKYLFLSDNVITVIDDTIFQSLPALLYLNLYKNPFTCDCSNAGFIQWVKSNNQTQVQDAHDYICYSPLIKQGTKVLDFDVQSCWMDVGFLCYISSSCLVVLTLLTSFIYHFLRWQIVYAFLLFQAFLYDSRKKRKGDPHLYDAFISYNVEDEAWVYREMLPVLEGEQGWRLCLHHRDFQPGKPIIENITDAIYSSRKTICVISRSYLRSEWCSREIQMASFRLFDEKKDVLILLFLEEIPSRKLSPYYRMRKLVKKRTYLSWPQAGRHKGVFWQNVHRALETEESTRDNVNLLTGPEEC